MIVAVAIKVVVIERKNSSSGEPEYDVLAAAHCIEAVYELVAEGSQSPQVAATIDEGITDAIVLYADVPDDCLTWVVDHFNTHNVGSGFSLQQAINRRCKLDSDFTQYKLDHNISIGKIGGPSALETCRRAWVKDLSGCPTFAGSYEFYDALGIFVNQLKLTGRHDKFMQVLKSHTGNLTPGVDLETIGRNIHAVDKIMRTTYEDTLGEARYELVWWQAVQACLPPSSSEQLEQLLVDSRLPDSLQWVTASMGGAKQVVVKLKKKKVKPLTAKAKAKAGQNDADPPVVQPYADNADLCVTQTPAQLKESTFLHDVCWSIDNGCSFLLAAGLTPDHVLADDVKLCVQRSLELLWNTKCKFQKVEHLTWDTLKVEIIKFMYNSSNAHLAAMKSDSERCALKVDSSKANLTAFREFVADLHPEAPPPWANRPYYKKAMLAVSKMEIDLGGSLRSVCLAVVDAIDKVVPLEWIQVLIEYADSRGDPDQELAAKMFMLFPVENVVSTIDMDSLNMMLGTRCG